ncbi:MAG: 3-isopropylmalate dehydratase small subunit [Acidobacteriota bacterium]|jgi:3-isopropylmalate/(R)-2-methylmalate dehydratase small subunit|nr:3-isopropylmalate dehydratase small subunit [Acidobacteriota bacterium]
MIITGKLYKFGDDVNTDEIIPARYLNTSDPKELAAHVMEDADAKFPSLVKPGDIIVAGKNFGCGSSREHAPLAIKAAGVACVVAESYARIFYRNAFNIGLTIMESAVAADAATGHVLEVDAATGKIVNVTLGKEYASKPIPPFMQELIAAGGLMEYVRKGGF